MSKKKEKRLRLQNLVNLEWPNKDTQWVILLYLPVDTYVNEHQQNEFNISTRLALDSYTMDWW